MPEPLIIWTYDWVPPPGRGGGARAASSATFGCAGPAKRPGWITLFARFPSKIAGPPTLRASPLAGAVPRRQRHRDVRERAALLHLAGKSDALMPPDRQGAAETLQWVIAALNSIEMVTLPWWFVGLSAPEDNPLEGWMASRLEASRNGSRRPAMARRRSVHRRGPPDGRRAPHSEGPRLRSVSRAPGICAAGLLPARLHQGKRRPAGALRGGRPGAVVAIFPRHERAGDQARTSPSRRSVSCSINTCGLPAASPKSLRAATPSRGSNAEH